MNPHPKDGGPAFPETHWDGSAKPDIMARDMTLRDLFAGQALASMTVAPDYSKGPCDEAMANRAYFIADAMLKARELTS